MNSPELSNGACRMVRSAAMNRELPVLVFVPTAYHSGDKKYRVCYLLHGSGKPDTPLTEATLRSVYARDFKMQEIADVFNLIIVAPITGNSCYLDSPLKPESQFATYTGKELPAFMDENYRTIAARDGRILAGFSMGGYGAVSLLCRFPDTFSVAASRGGVFDLAFGIRDYDWDEAGATDLLGSFWQNRERYHRHSCFNLINPIRDRKDCRFILEVGMDDFLIKDNRLFHQKLIDIKMPHIYAEYPTAHSWHSSYLITMLMHYTSFNHTFFSA